MKCSGSGRLGLFGLLNLGLVICDGPVGNACR